VTVKKFLRAKKSKENTVPDQWGFLLAFPRREAPRFLREAKKTGKAKFSCWGVWPVFSKIAVIPEPTGEYFLSSKLFFSHPLGVF